jgi:hypothetical protein
VGDDLDAPFRHLVHDALQDALGLVRVEPTVVQEFAFL